MQIILNLDDIDLADWIDWDGEETTVPQFSEIFLGEIRSNIIDRLMSYDLKAKVTSEIDKPLKDAIFEYVKSGALKEAVAERIKSRPIYGNENLTFWDRYKKDVHNEVDIYAKKLQEEFEFKISKIVSDIVKDKFNSIFKNIPLSQYIDKEKLSEDVFKILSKGE